MKTYNRSLLSFAFSVIVLSALNVVVVSCRSASSRLLDQIAAMVTDRPEEALFALAEVDTTGFSVVEKAQVVYLHTRAAAKANLPLTWPDEMRDAAKVLAEHTSDRDEQSMAYYYAGYAYFKNNRLADAVREYHNSERILGDVLTKPMFKHVQYALFRCYYNQSLYKDAVGCLRLNLRAAEVQYDTVDIIDTKNVIAHINMIQKNYDSAWHYYSESQHLLALYSHEETGSFTRCYNGMSTVLYKLGRFVV